MPTKLGVIVITGLCLPFFNCGGGDDSTGAQSSNDAGADAIAVTDSGPIVDSAPVDSGPVIVTVNGTLMGRAGDGGPLASRDLTIVDANGAVTKTTSDANGKFSASAVQTPYDIAVPYVPLDAGGPAFPRYFAGITRADPTVKGVDYNKASAGTPLAQTTTLSFTATVCSGCSIFVAGPDSPESGTLTGTGTSQLFNQMYGWSGAA
ncbi:MAG: hypothetical protein ABI183_05760, partial [Polyangiaceae bacterium]